MKRGSLAILFILCGLTGQAHAQLAAPQLTQWTFGPLLLTINHPNSTEGLINCNFGQSYCKPANLAACTENPARELDIILQRNNVTFPAQGTPVNFFAWLQNSATICQWNTNGVISNANSLIISQQLTASAGVVNASIPMNFPSDFNIDLTIPKLLNMYQVCPPNTGILTTTWTLCMGFDTNNDNSISSGDVVNYIQFQVATTPPATPGVPTSVSLKERCNLTVPLDSSAQNIYQVQVVSQEQDGSVDPNCNNWTDGFQTVTTPVTVSISSVDTVINGDNGTNYIFCARTIDGVGNPSPYSQSATCTPHEECDLIECYPTTLDTGFGFCGAAMSPSLVGLVGGAVVWRVVRRRRSA